MLLISEQALPCPSTAVHVHRVTAGDGLAVGRSHHRLAGIDELPPLGCKLLGHQLLRWNIHHARVGNVPVSIGESQPHRLDQVVISVDRLRTHGPDVEPLDDVQGLQRGDALAVGRAFPAGDAPVVGGNRLVPIGGVGRQVLGGQPPAVLLDEGRHLFSDRAVVEGLAAALGDGPQRGCKRGEPDQVALPRGVPVHQHLLPRRVGAQLGQEILPLKRDDLGHREAVLGVAYGWLQQPRQGHAAALSPQRLPAVHRPPARTPSRDPHRALTGSPAMSAPRCSTRRRHDRCR